MKYHIHKAVVINILHMAIVSGFGYIAFARNGALLTRTIADISVLSPERLIYEARPILGEGIDQKERAWTHRPGEPLNGIPALTDEEDTRYDELVVKAKRHPDTVAQAEKLLGSHHAGRVRKLADTKKITVEEAETQLPRHTLADREKSSQELGLNDTVEIGGETILISEPLERGEEFDRSAMPDPIEGSSYGTTTAKYYYNNGNSACINSFAHGKKTVYKIIWPESDANIPDRSKNEVLANDHSDLTKPLDPEGFPHTKTLNNGSVKPICTIENVEHLLNSYGIIAQYDVIGKEIQILIPGQSGVTENSANTAIERINSLASLNGLPTAQVPRYVAVIADENPINRVADWMRSKNWDGIDRIDAICDTLVTQEGFPKALKKTLVTKWLRSVVAAATTPHGFHTRGVLTLQGPQLIGKSSWIRNLMPPGLLRDRSILTGHHLDPGNKDSLTTAIKHLIVEIGELDSSFKRDIARLKGFLTQDRDSVRRPYARTNAEYQRRTVFCATVNDDRFLVDHTGNSRFLTITVESINYEHGIDTQQLFAQLHVELQQGAEWWLTQEENEQLEKLNKAHRAVNAIEERILMVMNPDLPNRRWAYKKPDETDTR